MAIQNAIDRRNFNLLNWFNENNLDIVEWPRHAMDWAAETGHLDIVKWLHINRTEGCTFKAIVNAANNGHLDVVQWLHENRVEGRGSNALLALSRAEWRLHHHIVEYLRPRVRNC
jgi:hypothetical protein